MQKNHFELLNLPARFTIDAALLEQNFRKIQSEVHPDRFVSAPPAERLQSMQLATSANEAYQTLKNPTSRGRYLLQLEGIDTEEESNTSMPTEFLMLQMEWREAIDDARSAGDIAALDSLLGDMKQEASLLQQTLSVALDEDKDFAGAAEAVRKLNFIDKVREDIARSIEKLEDN
ncbi:MAG: Fe-S protein assembly co-chaperone HscB [Methylophilaceae bacterium]